MESVAEVRKSSIREVTDYPPWQTVRESFLGTWKHTPEANVDRLRLFLAEEQWSPRAVRIVLNYLTGTGFRLGILVHPAIASLRNQVRKEWQVMVAEK